MAIRFYKAGLTPGGPNVSARIAQAPVPDGTVEPTANSNLNANGDSDVIPIGKYSEASVMLYSDTTCSATLLVSVGPTPTGPWSAIGTASVNPPLATPVLVNPFANGRAEYAKVTTGSYVSGNPRALFSGITKTGYGAP